MVNKVLKIGYVGFPVQSGSEKILQLMRRGHTAEDAKNALLLYNKPHLGLI
jgi:tRNA A37 methylthiotransferase MiaB